MIRRRMIGVTIRNRMKIKRVERMKSQKKPSKMAQCWQSRTTTNNSAMPRMELRLLICSRRRMRGASGVRTRMKMMEDPVTAK